MTTKRSSSNPARRAKDTPPHPPAQGGRKGSAPNSVRLAEGAAGAAAVLGPLVLYVLTLPRTVVLEDDGLFLMAGEHFGVAHPPGYPLYTLLCYLFMRLPFGEAAVLGHVSSAVLGALACGGVYACARLLGATWLPALAAAWLFGASEHVWSQAIIAEVYTLNALLFFATYALLLHGVRHPEHEWAWGGAAAAYGLSLANHWPLMVLATPGLLVAALPVRTRLLPRLPRLALVAVACASLPYAWMVVRSWQEPLISFYGSIDDWGAFWHYVSRSGYADVDVSPSAGWGDRFAFLWWFCRQVLWQLTPPGCALAAFGLWTLLRRRRSAGVTRSGGSLFVFQGNSVLLIALLGFDFDAYNVTIFRPYSLVCYGLAAVWLAVGAQELLDRLSSATRAGPWVRTGAAALAGAGMIAYSVSADWSTNDRAGSDFSTRYADTMFDLLPPNAVLFVFGDAEIGPLGYFRFVERRRPDVTLISTQGLVYGNRLFSWRLPKPQREAILRRFVAETDRPVFYTVGEDDFPHGLGVRRHGFVKEVSRQGAPGTLELRFHEASDRYFATLLKNRPTDAWEEFRRTKLLFLYGEHLGYAVLSANPELLERVRPMLGLADGSFFSLIGMAEVLMEHGTAAHLAQVEEWLDKAAHRQDEIMSKERRGRFLYLRGFCAFRLGRKAEGVALFEKSRAVYPHPKNAALGALQQLGR